MPIFWTETLILPIFTTYTPPPFPYMVGKLWISASIWHRAINIWRILSAVRISRTHPDRFLNSSWHCVINPCDASGSKRGHRDNAMSSWNIHHYHHHQHCNYKGRPHCKNKFILPSQEKERALSRWPTSDISADSTGGSNWGLQHPAKWLPYIWEHQMKGHIDGWKKN